MKPVTIWWLMIIWAMSWIALAPLQFIVLGPLPVAIVVALILSNRKFRLWWFKDTLMEIKKQKENGEQTSYFILYKEGDENDL